MNFGNIGNMWCWILGALKLWKICCVGLVEWIHDEYGKFIDMCNSYFMSMAKFCRCEFGRILWWHFFLLVMKLWLQQAFVKHEILVMEISLLGIWCWMCDKFCGCGFGHRKFLRLWFWFMWIFFVIVILVMGNFCSCDFDHRKFLGMWFWSWEIFVIVILVGMGFFVIILTMGLTLVFIDFSGESNDIGWCHQKIFGGKDHKSWTWDSAARISISCKSRRKHWRRLL